MPYIPVVNEDKCIGCAECVNVCPVGVFEMQNDKSKPVNPEECVGCESCVEICDANAIKVEEN